MSVYRAKDRRTYRYDFWFQGTRYSGSTGQLRREDAERWEKREQLRLAQRAGGVAPFVVGETPRFQDWAEIYYRDAVGRMKRPDRVKANLRVVLRFWGARPTAPKRATDGAVYHDLRLGDPIVDPTWIVRFEAWLSTLPVWRHRRGQGLEVRAGAVGRSAQTRNQYRSLLSQLFVLAMRPAWRAQTGITVNPFVGVARDQPRRRTVALDPDELRRLIAAAAPHVRLALCIGALAPKLRRANILGLRWDQIDPHLNWITVHDHKTDRAARRPLVVPVSAQLREVLLDARARAPKATHVVTYRGQPLKDIRDGVRAAAARAGLPYGRGLEHGLTFHTLRHTAATVLAELVDDPTRRQATMGHQRLETTQQYTHLRPRAELDPIERLAEHLQIADLVIDPDRRPLAANFGGKRTR